MSEKYAPVVFTFQLCYEFKNRVSNMQHIPMNNRESKSTMFEVFSYE